MPRRWGPKTNAGYAPDDQQTSALQVGSKSVEENILDPPRRCLVGAPADLFSEDRQRFAKNMDVVKLNFSFHDRQLHPQQYQSWSRQLRELGLSAVVKASRLATHERQLEGAEEWWPQLRAAYGEFQKQGVLAAVLWQCAPSFKCSAGTLKSLESLCKLLCSWTGTRHVFEFRHSSWYKSEAALEVLRLHGCCLAWLNLCDKDATQWTDSDCWSLCHSTANFLYLQLHGAEGRALGRYSEKFLQDLTQRLPRDKDVIILFCQVDVPFHAWSDAEMMRENLGLTRKSERASARVRIPTNTKLSGRVVKLTPRLVILDVVGRTGIIGRNHLRHGFLCKVCEGDILSGLRVEAIEEERIWLSGGQPEEDQAGRHASNSFDDATSGSNESLVDLLREIEDHVSQQNSELAKREYAATRSSGLETPAYRTSEISSYVADAVVDDISSDGVHVSLSSGLAGALSWEGLWGGQQSSVQVGDTITVLVQRGGRTAKERISMALPKHMLAPWAPRLEDHSRRQGVFVNS